MPPAVKAVQHLAAGAVLLASVAPAVARHLQLQVSIFKMETKSY